MKKINTSPILQMELSKRQLKPLAYPFGYMLSSGVSFIITIWLTNYFTKADFGNFSIFKASVFTMWPFIGISTHFYLQSRFHRDEPIEFKSRLFSSLLLNFILFLALELVCLMSYRELGGFLGLDGKWIFAIPLISLCMCIVRISLVIMQLGEKPARFLIISIVQVIFNIGLIYYLVALSSYNWEGQAIAYLSANLFAALLGLILLYGRGYLSFVRKVSFFRDALLFGLSAIMVDICIVSIGFSDKIFIKKIVSTESLGIYAVALQLAAVISVIDSAFTQAIYPRLYKYYSVNNKKRVWVESALYVMGLSIFSLLYIWIAPFLYSRFIGEAFAESIFVMKLVVISFVILSIYKILVSKLYYLKRMQELIYPSLGIIILNLTAHYYLVPLYGIAGAIYTNIISYGLLAMAVFYVTQKSSPVIKQ